MIDTPLLLPNQLLIEQAHHSMATEKVSYGNSRLERSEGSLLVIKIQRDEQEKPDERKPADVAPGKSADQGDQNQTKAAPGAAAAQTGQAQEQRSFWGCVFNLPPLR